MLFSDSFSPKSLEPTDTGSCTISEYKVEVLELVPDCKLVCVFVCVCVRMCLYVHVSMCMRVSIWVGECACIYLGVCMFLCILSVLQCMYVCMYCICVLCTDVHKLVLIFISVGGNGK